MPSVSSMPLPLYDQRFQYYKGSIVNIYPYPDQRDYTLNGGSWLVIQFPPHSTGGMTLPKIVYTGSEETATTSAMGIVPGNHIFRKNVIGLAMCLRIQ